MHTPQELEAKFWKALSSDMTVMLGLDGADDGHTRPMTAQVEDGKNDPKLALLRFDAERAEIWLNESGMLAGARLLLGSDPKKSYKDHVAKVQLHPPG
jgi:general stress protein 26